VGINYIGLVDRQICCAADMYVNGDLRGEEPYLGIGDEPRVEVEVLLSVDTRIQLALAAGYAEEGFRSVEGQLRWAIGLYITYWRASAEILEKMRSWPARTRPRRGIQTVTVLARDHRGRLVL
jgi:hypothetical protein